MIERSELVIGNRSPLGGAMIRKERMKRTPECQSARGVETGLRKRGSGSLGLSAGRELPEADYTGCAAMQSLPAAIKYQRGVADMAYVQDK